MTRRMKYVKPVSGKWPNVYSKISLGMFHCVTSCELCVALCLWCIVTHCDLVTSYGDIDPWVNISLGNGLLPDGTKPLPEPMLTEHQWGSVVLTSQEVLKISIHKTSLINTLVKLLPSLSGASGFTLVYNERSYVCFTWTHPSLTGVYEPSRTLNVDPPNRDWAPLSFIDPLILLVRLPDGKMAFISKKLIRQDVGKQKLLVHESERKRDQVFMSNNVIYILLIIRWC